MPPRLRFGDVDLHVQMSASHCVREAGVKPEFLANQYVWLTSPAMLPHRKGTRERILLSLVSSVDCSWPGDSGVCYRANLVNKGVHALAQSASDVNAH